MVSTALACHAGIRGTARKWNVALLAGGKMKTKALTAEHNPLAELTAWLGKQGVELEALHVCVEVADEHVRAFAMALHDNGVTVSRVGREAMATVAALAGKVGASPAADAIALARYCAVGNPAAWMPPPPEERLLEVALESLTAYRNFQLTEQEHLVDVRRNGMDDLARGIEEHLDWLGGAIARIEQEVQRLLEEHPHLKDRHARLPKS